MRPVVYAAQRLREAFAAAKVLTMEMILDVLGRPTRMTAFRKLATLDYRASYSHGGRYYTLNEIAQYGEHGLWTFDEAHFSLYGSLLDTLEHLVGVSAEGYFARELHSLVQVPVHNALAKLHRAGRLKREQLGSEFLYVSNLMGQTQLHRREERLMQLSAETAPEPEQTFGFVSAQMLHALLGALNEKQRRLYLGFESAKLGRGGDSRIARIAGVDVKTVTRGRTELLAGDIDMARIRAVGAGRPSVKKNRSDRTVE
jgi:hypothetical protein